MNIFKNLYSYRELLKTNVKKDVRGKYKKSTLGVLWSFLNPLLQIVVYSFVFGKILNASEDNYAIFICCGLIPWIFFSTSINRSTMAIVDGGAILKKVYFPREIFPISVITAEAVNFVISTIIILAFVLIGGVGISRYWLFYPLILLVLYLFLVGASLILSSITVYFRDLQHFTAVFLQLLFYATPVAYAGGRVPESYQWILHLNPMSYIIQGFRDIFLYHQAPNVIALLILGAISLVLCVLGYLLFNKLQKRFAEEL